jgi:methylenetetrahydrofolate dehydrogenase (NADP+)/methenyltetrahydrofolate cyclohydrolase
MENKILDGKKLAEQLNSALKKRIVQARKKIKIAPKLATILVGDNPASKIYINIKQKTCKQVGIDSTVIDLKKTIEKEKLIDHINNLNTKGDIHAILLQLPLPSHLQKDLHDILENIHPEKDVDGLHPKNLGNLYYNKEKISPCTPMGILKLLERYDIELKGKDITIINHSNLLGRPLAQMFLNRNASVSVCHEYTKDLKQYTQQADILVVGVGKAKFITEDYIKEDSIIIDVGINRVEGELYGDVDFKDVLEKVFKITPVPGGVGPLTVAMLLQNTYYLYRKQLNISSI